MLLASAVVVWEWLNEHGRWRPYSPAVSHHIEAVIRSDPRGAGSVVLGQVDSRLSPYIIDLQSMHQFRQDTGTLRPVRRSFYDPRSAPGQGWMWEWENDSGSWTPYDTEVGIAIQAARDRQQPWLDLTPLGFCYLIDLQSMTQINRQTQRRRRIQRRSDLAYPLVSGPLPKPHAWASNGGGGHLGVGVSGVTGGNGSAYPSGALPASAITSLGQPCSCQQCMLVLGVKAPSMAQTLGRKPPPMPKPPSPKAVPRGHSYSLTLPHPPSLSRALSPHRNSTSGASSAFGHSLSLLGSATAALSLSSSRPPPPAVPPPPPPSAMPHVTAPPGTTQPPPSSALISTATTCAPTPSARVLGPVPSAAAACAAPLPSRSSLAGLSRPALQRIAMAQSRALIASGCCNIEWKLGEQQTVGPSMECYSTAHRKPFHWAPHQLQYLKKSLSEQNLVLPVTLFAAWLLVEAPARTQKESERVPTVPVKNLNGSSPVHPALAGITGILMSAAGLPVCLTRPPKLVLHPPPVSKSDIKPVPGLGHCCRKTTKKQARKGRTPEEVVRRYLQKRSLLFSLPPVLQDCTICMEALAGPSGYKGPGVGGISRAESVGRLSQCGHQYHLQCLVAMYNNGNKDGSLQCPTCKTIYGVKTGNQPPGKMEYHVIPHSLPGHPDCKTIRIIYNIPPGIQGPEHPNPGKPFTARGFPRHCYLPDSEKGRLVLKLLLVAWDRRLIFSVGTSSTTGETDTVIWNEVHHKTEFGSNLTGHGYPDSGHLDNVLEELRAQGIAEEDCLRD
ncbi:hypothetical protein P4O66_008356 [Electrophorus voltai]|uniref:E3 ubiquitin-protein ligase n=1 Tax=Electrophorus voltai TaxID=2609070 RepID=A0AAD8ZF71_9TELE|nr:hypothetical protein P4O66_008356 [Electrophorus voltai]